MGHLWHWAVLAVATAFGQPVGSESPAAELSVWPPPQSLAAAGPPRLVDSLLTITAAAAAATSNPVLSAGIDRHVAILRAANDHTAKNFTAAQRAGALLQLHVHLEQPAVTELSFTSAGLGVTDYSYELVIDRSSPTANLTARTAFGALYGLETFTQLLLQNPPSGLLLGASAVRVMDAPEYSWRGLMIDAGRRFWQAAPRLLPATVPRPRPRRCAHPQSLICCPRVSRL